MRALAGLLALAFTLAVPTFSQTDSQKNSPPQRTTASSGALAVEADVAGTLFIDGQRRSAIVASKVTDFNLMPGQHIVELRDTKGNILWKDTVTVPKGEQVVQRISAKNSASKADVVAAAIKRIVMASPSDFVDDEQGDLSHVQGFVCDFSGGLGLMNALVKANCVFKGK